MKLIDLFSKQKIDLKYYNKLVKSSDFDNHVKIWSNIIELTNFKRLDKNQIRLIRKRLIKGTYSDVTTPFDKLIHSKFQTEIDPFLISILKSSRGVEIASYLYSEYQNFHPFSVVAFEVYITFQGVLTNMEKYNIPFKVVDELVFFVNWKEITDNLYLQKKHFSKYAALLYHRFSGIMFDKNTTFPASTEHFWYMIRNGILVNYDDIVECYNTNSKTFTNDVELWQDIILDYFSFKQGIEAKDFFARKDFLTFGITSKQKKHLTTFLDMMMQDTGFLLKMGIEK